MRKLASDSPASSVSANMARANTSGEPKWRTRPPRGSTRAMSTRMLARPPMVPHTSETPRALAALPWRVSSQPSSRAAAEAGVPGMRIRIAGIEPP